MTGDPELDLRIGRQDGGLAIERLLIRGTNNGLVVIEVDHGGEVVRDRAGLFGGLALHPLLLQPVPLGAVIHRLRSRGGRCSGGGLRRRLFRSGLSTAGNGKCGGSQEHQQGWCSHHHSEIMGWEWEWSARVGETTLEAERRRVYPVAALDRFRCRQSRSGGGRFGQR